LGYFFEGERINTDIPLRRYASGEERELRRDGREGMGNFAPRSFLKVGAYEAEHFFRVPYIVHIALSGLSLPVMRYDV